MGGHAFPHLYCPRMPQDVYLKMRQQTSEALQKLFTRVVVATEMPDKEDYGDVDFLVSGFLSKPCKTSEKKWAAMVSAVSAAFNTKHCRRGFLNPDVIFSAIPVGGESGHWVQIDVKVVEKADEQSFEWQLFELNYASASKMLGSLLKPLGMTMDPEGLHVRVAEMEETNFPGSMVFVSKDPRDLLKIVGLDWKILHAGFASNEEIYRHLASSWIFHAEHFEARLKDKEFMKRLEERAPQWLHFISEWIPKHYPEYHSIDKDMLLAEWYKTTRVALREKVFTLFPAITMEYYTKRAAYLNEVEEQRLRGVLLKAIPTMLEGWSNDFPHPHVIIKSEVPATPAVDPMAPSAKLNTKSALIAPDNGPPSPPRTPVLAPSLPSAHPRLPVKSTHTPVYLTLLPRETPIPFTTHPPSASMSLDAKLVCIARWTLFDPTTGLPHLASEPREKKFEMRWSEHGVRDEVLVAWVKEMWWMIWMRQALVNYVGMWKHRLEKEDAKAAKAKELAEKVEQQVSKAEDMEVNEETLVPLATDEKREEVDVEIKAKRAKILARVMALDH